MLTIDAEEFDIPLEYGQNIDMHEQMETGRRGLDSLALLLEKSSTPSTIFTTANFAMRYADDIQYLSRNHEIASHTFYHSHFENEHLLSSKKVLEQITGKRITGLRMPRMRKIAMAEVADAGYLYDSSVNPTWLPGRYNNFHLSRTVYTDEKMVRVPASVSPGLRIPLFWLGFKNYPYPAFLWLCKQTLRKDGYLCLYFHPWEFADLHTYKLPGYVKKPDGLILLKRLERLINDLLPVSHFITMNDFLVLKNYI